MSWRNLAALTLIQATLLGAGTLHLKTRTFEPGAAVEDSVTAPLRHWRPGSSHYLLQFKGPISQSQLDDLKARGVTVTGAVPDNAVMVAAPDGVSFNGLDVAWIGRHRPTDKLSPVLANAVPLGYVVEVHADVSAADATLMLLDAGVQIIDRSGLVNHQFLVVASPEQVAYLQAWDEVSYIFPASQDLLAGVDLVGCSGPLTQSGHIAQYVLVGHGWPLNGASVVVLNYYFGTLTTKVPDVKTKSEILRAFNEWGKYVKFHLNAGTDAQAPNTIAILYGSGSHGDAFPFDSSGLTLAHTFYPAPPNPEPIAGDMHFNAVENWNAGGNIDIYTVALHEFGHALGLGHTDNPGDIMYPYYRLGAQLSADDIAGAVNLYGAAVAAPNVPATAPVVPAIVPPVTPAINPPAAPPTTPSIPKTSLTLSVIAPVPATTDASISLAGTASLATGSISVTWQTDHGAAGLATGSANWSIPAVPLELGANMITITAMDAAHLPVTAVISITRQALSAGPDTLPPDLTLISPSATTLSTTDAGITASGTATDNIGVSTVTWLTNAGTSGTATGTANWQATIPLYVGTNRVVIRAYDAAGNFRWRSFVVVRR